MSLLLPGATIGLLGGGQLGRMMALAARPMGYSIVALDPNPSCPASTVVDDLIVAPFDDLEAARSLARRCQTVTIEFENLPARMLEAVAAQVPTRPDARALAIAQDRILEKGFIRALGLPVTPHVAIEGLEDLAPALELLGLPAMLKTATLGYDGRNQVRINAADQAQEAYARLGGARCVLEAFVPFERELSIVAARDVYGRVACYPVAENVHVEGILDSSRVPARLPEALQEQALRLVRTLLEALSYVGVLAMELFCTSEGELLINEVAPRPHNSGHWSIEACETSQFEQQVRTSIGAPLGSTHLLSPACTVNLLGELWSEGEPDWARILVDPQVKLHLYGKKDARPGRKMGHLTCLAESSETALHTALAARDRLKRGHAPVGAAVGATGQPGGTR